MKRGLLIVLVLAIGVGIVAVVSRTSERANAEAPQAGGPIRWIVAGGGATPESNEVSIEDDLRLARTVFEGEGLTLFASGADNQAVRVEGGDLEGDPLVAELAAIFNPRPGRASRYRAAQITADGAASPRRFLDALRDASSVRGAPLTVYVAGHGDKGERAADNIVAMWANLNVTPVDVASGLAGAQRRTKLVFTTCFSGGFAEVAFSEADDTKGAVTADVCGLFASTWDLEAGGCDPDPDRGVHDGYGVHFLSALDGKTRDGRPIDADVAGDGRVSLLDAHTYARMKSGSIDVPTTTSERWLRAVVDPDSTAAPHAMPHEDAVIAALGPQFGDPTEAVARQRLEQLEAEITAKGEQEAAAVQEETDAYWDVSAALLARWPVLDDPWHPLWAQTLQENRDVIEKFLRTSALVQTLRSRVQAVNEISGERAALEVRRAPLMRLVRAHETRRLAAVLAARGGPDWTRFEAFRACEDSR